MISVTDTTKRPDMHLDLDTETRGPRVLMVGPSVIYPPRTGDSRRVFRIAQALRSHGVYVDLVGKNYRVLNDGRVIQDFDYDFQRDSRIRAGLKAALLRTHYNEIKHATREARTRLAPCLEASEYEFLYVNTLYVVPMVLPYLRGRPMLVDTQNSEWQWFDGLAQRTNAFGRFVCGTSKRRAEQMMTMLPSGTIMAHVSETDLADYRSRRPDLTHIVVANGCDTRPRTSVPDYSEEPRRLLFFGSLGSQMSFDALLHFRKAYWPKLKAHATLLVAGAHPPRAVVDLCAAEGWSLRRDLSEEEVAEVFSQTHYSVLPFTYGAGSKLKFLDACGRGVPVLATAAGACGQWNLPSYVTVSDDPDAWARVVRQGVPPGPRWREEVEAYGREFGWEHVVEPVLPLLAPYAQPLSK